MRNAINNTTNVTAVAIVNRSVATALVGVDALRTSLGDLRLYCVAAGAHAAPAMHRWALHFASKKQSAARKQQTGKKPAEGMPGCDLSRSRRAEPRCRRPRLSSCLRGS